MERTQISLTTDQAARLRRAAAGRGVSMSQLVREAVDAYVIDDRRDPATVARRALAVGGRFSSGRADGSDRHDDILAEDRRGW